MFGQIKNDDGSTFERIYVRVTADHKSDGSVFPCVLFWVDEDGIEVPYEIDRASTGRPAHAQKAGGQGLLYDITVEGRSRKLFYDDFEGRFFVEKERRVAIPNNMR